MGKTHEFIISEAEASDSSLMEEESEEEVVEVFGESVPPQLVLPRNGPIKGPFYKWGQIEKPSKRAPRQPVKHDGSKPVWIRLNAEEYLEKEGFREDNLGNVRLQGASRPANFTSLSKSEKDYYRKLYLRKLHPMYVRATPGMVYCPVLGLISDCGGKPFTIFQNQTKTTQPRRVNNFKLPPPMTPQLNGEKTKSRRKAIASCKTGNSVLEVAMRRFPKQSSPFKVVAPSVREKFSLEKRPKSRLSKNTVKKNLFNSSRKRIYQKNDSSPTSVYDVSYDSSNSSSSSDDGYVNLLPEKAATPTTEVVKKRKTLQIKSSSSSPQKAKSTSSSLSDNSPLSYNQMVRRRLLPSEFIENMTDSQSRISYLKQAQSKLRRTIKMRKREHLAKKAAKSMFILTSNNNDCQEIGIEIGGSLSPNLPPPPPASPASLGDIPLPNEPLIPDFQIPGPSRLCSLQYTPSIVVNPFYNSIESNHPSSTFIPIPNSEDGNKTPSHTASTPIHTTPLSSISNQQVESSKTPIPNASDSLLNKTFDSDEDALLTNAPMYKIDQYISQVDNNSKDSIFNQKQCDALKNHRHQIAQYKELNKPIRMMKIMRDELIDPRTKELILPPFACTVPDSLFKGKVMFKSQMGFNHTVHTSMADHLMWNKVSFPKPKIPDCQVLANQINTYHDAETNLGSVGPTRYEVLTGGQYKTINGVNCTRGMVEYSRGPPFGGQCKFTPMIHFEEHILKYIAGMKMIQEDLLDEHIRDRVGDVSTPMGQCKRLLEQFTVEKARAKTIFDTTNIELKIINKKKELQDLESQFKTLAAHYGSELLKQKYNAGVLDAVDFDGEIIIRDDE